MINNNVRNVLCEMSCEDSIMFHSPAFDDAVIGVSNEGNIIYDYELMIESLMKEDNISYEEAADFISYNTIRIIPYANDPKPIVMYGLIN